MDSKEKYSAGPTQHSNNQHLEKNIDLMFKGSCVRTKEVWLVKGDCDILNVQGLLLNIRKYVALHR